MLTLARGFLSRGHSVDVVLVRAEGVLGSALPSGVRLIELGTRRVILSARALARYLRRERPDALLSTLDTANIVAVWAGLMSRQPTRVAIRQATHLSRTCGSKSVPIRALLGVLARLTYPWADRVIAVSRGVADDLADHHGLHRERVHVVPNPIVTSDFSRLSDQDPVAAGEDWFAAGAPPVVLGVGRLTVQKRFDLLIDAFALARGDSGARLLILGEGEERSRLEALVRQRRLQLAVSLPGFVDNPLPYMARAKVFVLSSDYEGLPGALIQALACGTPVVATDCDSGPREILQGGRFGRLVPTGDVASLAGAIQAAVSGPRTPIAAEACLPYTEAAGVDAYLRILLEAPRG
jgi:glycosyltransferase involved in cell wall biosynthesis